MSLAVLLVVLSGLSGQVWVTEPEAIEQSADAVMTAVRDSDWEKLSELVLDQPVLNPQTGDENTAECLIWNAYRQSLQWYIEKDYEIQNSGMIQELTVTCLDISALTKQINGILAESATDHERESAMPAAVKQALNAEMPMMKKTVTLKFVSKEGKWQLVPNQSLLALLSGFTAN